jgi:hypothetical protein
MRQLFITTFLLASLWCGNVHAAPADWYCELGKSLLVMGDINRDSVIELGWKGQMVRMQRVGTSTGAQRFEDPVSGLIWISIPEKAMLLDGMKGEPLANGCKLRGAGRSVR